MNSIQVENLTVDELKKIIAEVFDEKVQRLIPEPKPEIKYLTRKETAKLLGVSLVTLHNWVKKGIIQAHRINTRIRFRFDEVDRALKEVESLKYQRG